MQILRAGQSSEVATRRKNARAWNPIASQPSSRADLAWRRARSGSRCHTATSLTTPLSKHTHPHLCDGKVIWEGGRVLQELCYLLAPLLQHQGCRFQPVKLVEILCGKGVVAGVWATPGWEGLACRQAASRAGHSAQGVLTQIADTESHIPPTLIHVLPSCHHRRPCAEGWSSGALAHGVMGRAGPGCLVHCLERGMFRPAADAHAWHRESVDQKRLP